MLGDHGRDLRQRAGLVDVLDLDARRETLRRGVLDIPADVEPTLRLLLEILQGRRLDRIDRNRLARRRRSARTSPVDRSCCRRSGSQPGYATARAPSP